MNSGGGPNRDQFVHPVGVRARVLKGDRSAEGVPDDCDRKDVECVEQLRGVERVVDHRVATADGPLGIAVTAQVGRDNVVVAPQVLGDPIPGPGMIAAAVNQEQRRPVVVAPVDVMELEPLRVEIVRRGSDQSLCHGDLPADDTARGA